MELDLKDLKVWPEKTESLSDPRQDSYLEAKELMLGAPFMAKLEQHKNLRSEGPRSVKGLSLGREGETEKA